MENLFARPAAFSTDTQADANQVLAAYREFNTLTGNPTYSATDRQRMRDLLVALDVYYVNTHGAVRRRFTQTPAWAWLRKNRGSFDTEPTDSTRDVEIIATGRGSWIGWLELATHAVNEIGTRMTAKVITDIDADILAIIEAEDRPSLIRLNDELLGGMYRHVMPSTATTNAAPTPRGRRPRPLLGGPGRALVGDHHSSVWQRRLVSGSLQGLPEVPADTATRLEDLRQTPASGPDTATLRSVVFTGAEGCRCSSPEWRLSRAGYGVRGLRGVGRDHPAVPDRALPRPREEWAVYARSTTFHGRPANIDAGIAFINSEAAPMLVQIEGCRGLSMLVDRATGHCIATSSWESEAAMRASDGQLRPIRDRGRDILGGSMQVDEWEIAVMHRTHHGECCRVSWLQGDLDAMTETVRVGILPELEQTPGFCSASLLVNRSTGMCCATTAWATREAMEASQPSADNMRSRTAQESGGEILDVHEFELAYAHLHVPEMA